MPLSDKAFVSLYPLRNVRERKPKTTIDSNKATRQVIRNHGVCEYFDPYIKADKMQSSRILFCIMQPLTKPNSAKDIARQLRRRERRAKIIKSNIKKQQKAAEVEELRRELDLLSIKGSVSGVMKSIETVERGRRPTREDEIKRRLQRSAAPSPPSRRVTSNRQRSKPRKRTESDGPSTDSGARDK